MKIRAGYFVAGMLFLLTSLATNIIFANFATTESLRQYNLYFPLVTAIGHLCLMGQATGITVLRFGTAYRHTAKRSLTSTAIITMLFASIVIVIAGQLYALSNSTSASLIAVVTFAAVGIAFRDFTINLLQISRNIRPLFVIALFVLVWFCTILYIFPTFDMLLVCYGSLFPVMLVALFQFIRKNKEQFWPPDLSVGYALFKEGWPSLPGVFLGALAAYLLRNVIETQLSVESFNASAFAMTVGISLFGTVLGAFLKTDTISLSEHVEKDNIVGATINLRQIHLILLCVSVLALLVSETVGDYLVTSIFGVRFAGYFWVFAVFSIISSMSFSAGTLSLFLQFNNRMKLSVVLSLIGPVLAPIIAVALGVELNMATLCLTVGAANAVGLLIMLVITKPYRHNNPVDYLHLLISTSLIILLVFLHQTPE